MPDRKHQPDQAEDHQRQRSEAEPSSQVSEPGDRSVRETATRGGGDDFKGAAGNRVGGRGKAELDQGEGGERRHGPGEGGLMPGAAHAPASFAQVVGELFEAYLRDQDDADRANPDPRLGRGQAREHRKEGGNSQPSPDRGQGSARQ